MAVVCDRCMGKDSHAVSVAFMKRDRKAKADGGQPKSGPPRHMLLVPMDLCEQCINDFLRSFGKFKVKFMKEADEPEEVKE